MRNVTVSIIIPVYKVENYLNRCVDSVLGQTYRDIEIILIDDGSPDSCPEICDQYAEKDARVQVIHKENGGLSSARNAGLMMASGTYIMFVDSDDWIVSNAVEILVRDMVAYGQPDMCCFRMAKSDGIQHSPIVKNYHIKELKGRDSIVQDALLGTNIRTSACSKIYASHFIRKHNFCFQEGVINEDSIFNLTVAAYASHVIFEDAVLYFVYSNEQSISRNIKELNFTSIFIVYDHITNLYKKLGIYNRWKDYITASFIKMCAYTLVQAAYRLEYSLFKTYYRIIKDSPYGSESDVRDVIKLLPVSIQRVYHISKYPKLFFISIKFCRLLGLKLQ